MKKVKLNEIKWRIVFDASSHDPGMPSLNDTLEVGPNLLPETIGCLLRLRMHKYAITGDGKQAFLQLSLHKNDRDSTRFFWYKLSQDKTSFTDEITTYRFTRLPFGLACSPFLLCAAAREVASNHIKDFPIAAPMIDKHLYMDDFVASVETESKIATLHKEVKELMKLIEIPMEKWATNSRMLQNQLTNQDEGFKTIVKVLGIEWNTETDTLGNAFSASLCAVKDKPITKRLVLRCIASLYDPLGLFSPFTILGKILFQDTWLNGVKWDEILPPPIAERWQKWISELLDLENIRIPRWVGISPSTDIEIHVFCDASERAYGAVLYIRYVQDNAINVRLVCSRNRISPIKKITLPRLELLATLIGARLLHYFCRETNLNSNLATLWTDSTVALGWIRGDPNRWKTFVCNRTTEIMQYTTPAQWRHCPGAQNPADHLSRGVLPAMLSTLNLWWNGPDWLKEPEVNWPRKCLSEEDLSLITTEERSIKTQYLCTIAVHSTIDISRFSSYVRLIRVTAWVLRFLHNCRSQHRISSDLTSDEFKEAKDYWIRIVQQQCFAAEIDALQKARPFSSKSKIARFNPFLQDNILRLGGRLQFANLPTDTKHPILLDGSHPFVKLLIHYTHIRLHHLGVRIVLSELRSNFWILRGRQAIKQTLRNCLPCKISRAKCGDQIEAPLPADRLTQCKPFDTTGIDFAGPVYVRNAKSLEKAYITLFTCSTTRALHIELVSDLTTDKFLMALQRFVGRRGIPHTIYTDNATTFQAANKELITLWNTMESKRVQQYYAQNGIRWKFIVPRAAWWGGWWERLVGLTKQCLRKSLGRALLDEESLSTVLVGVEAALNSRPLVYEEGNEDTENALTPGHFLTGQKLTTIPSDPAPTTRNLIRFYAQQQDLLDTFWRKWSKEYLLQLRTFHHVRNAKNYSNIRIGDLVLLQEEMRPRHQWKKALVQELIKGRDGKIRSCVVRVNNQLVTRPVQLVIPLEIDQGGEDVASA